VIPPLRKAGMKVLAVQNPRGTLENDVAFNRIAMAVAPPKTVSSLVAVSPILSRRDSNPRPPV
jgi:hypothetical protein